MSWLNVNAQILFDRGFVAEKEIKEVFKSKLNRIHESDSYCSIPTEFNVSFDGTNGVTGNGELAVTVDNKRRAV